MWLFGFLHVLVQIVPFKLLTWTLPSVTWFGLKPGRKMTEAQLQYAKLTHIRERRLESPGHQGQFVDDQKESYRVAKRHWEGINGQMGCWSLTAIIELELLNWNKYICKYIANIKIHNCQRTNPNFEKKILLLLIILICVQNPSPPPLPQMPSHCPCWTIQLDPPPTLCQINMWKYPFGWKGICVEKGLPDNCKKHATVTGQQKLC